MDWLKQYGPASCGLLASAWLAAYAGFNMGANAKLEAGIQDAPVITGSTTPSAAPAPIYGRPHSD